mmetsp:Transcript_18384/g.46247  ORF Transcript_18384/g.46247 Transcript_18384/m.46247 type:complete len:166 (+) Transcript_18384:3-500(+)
MTPLLLFITPSTPLAPAPAAAYRGASACRAARHVVVACDGGAKKSVKPGERLVEKAKSMATWVPKNFPDFKRGAGSDAGFDLRPKSLRDPSMKEKCDCCKGAGTQECEFCADGVFTTRTGAEIKCPQCGGKTVVSCGICRGTGNLVELYEGWEEGGFDGQYYPKK